MTRLGFAVLLALGTITSVSASEAAEWQALPGMTSASLAQSGWRQTGAAGLSWPDGRQAVVSFWESTSEKQRFTFRCVAYFDKDFHQTGDACYQAVGKD
ncbi:hypothetical protein CIT31_29715 [Mesorhizobium wenxiniae]|uniref:Uncharacterized protein n=1 Tax=Mesorhizobium wenxiniae TaxID=2014805 RepID=A0A271K912_9HYPH|nr:hypothetical protein CIT31_29715 [Mesorhizobium wenxiniae]